MPRQRRPSAKLGSIKFIDLGEPLLISAAMPGTIPQLTHLRSIWSPAATLRKDVFVGFKIAFDVVFTKDGHRCFMPTGSLKAFESLAWLAGLAVLNKERRLSRRQIDAYRIMHLIFIRAHKLRTHLDRKFSSAADLIVRRSGRDGSIDATILPDSLGKDSARKGRRWSVTRLIEEGRARAGQNECREAQAIANGLMVAAERNPLDVDDTGATRVVRAALFDCEADRALPEIVDIVEDRLISAFKAHENDTQADFDEWYQGGKSNLPKSLANQARAAGGRLDIDLVQGALLELVWRSYQYEAGCLNMFAQAFVQALPQPLNPDERRLFSNQYQPQPYLGGLPLALVSERSALLSPLLDRIWAAPEDRSLWNTLYRVLHYYSEMTSLRRRADRHSKKAKRTTHILNENVALSSTESAELAEELGIKGGMKCQNRDCNIHFELGLFPETERSVVISAQCTKHGPLKPLALTAEEAQALHQGSD